MVKSVMLKRKPKTYTKRVMKYRGAPFRPLSEERGVLDTAFTCSFTNGANQIYYLNATVQGVNFFNRTGNRQINKSLELNIAITPGSAGVITQISYLVVYDRQPNGAAPVIADILTTASPIAFTNQANKDRFKVLCRRRLTILGTSANPADTENYFHHEYLVMDLESIYNQTNGSTIADCTTGTLLFVAVGDQALGSTDADAAVQSRLIYNK